ncbi:hypothetical protein I302_106470 [Kwoniella bestiolae CBS 10118]|uniref:Uncharacterized protein n=1 Tax=Kwoniella bestiolae CBS 10118 TaxID=1296100 RepID=A0A1B9G1B0_9TREE|nr:hypothetical protein I302_06273 [Kwoniella bestiolae CBS 10118]OCF24812.1 hypothetical protein I302_06273 [Kwoniella bestiolae CBS 10118]
MQPQSTYSAPYPTVPDPSLDGRNSDTTTHDTPALLSSELGEYSSAETDDKGIESPDNHYGSCFTPSLEVSGAGISTYEGFTPIDTNIEAGHSGEGSVMPHCNSADGAITSKSLLEYWKRLRQRKTDEYLSFKE